MEILKSKFFWLNLIAILIEVAQYCITSSLFPEYTVLITTIIGFLTVISNAIAGMVQSSQVTQLKSQLKQLKR